MPHNQHDINDFMVSATREMSDQYQLICKHSSEDPGTAGDQGEENWAQFLREWLSPYYHIVTKGRILGHQGVASPQVDILVLHPTYPRKLLDRKYYLAGGGSSSI